MIISHFQLHPALRKWMLDCLILADVAEETTNASRTIPKAMRMTIYIGGAAAIFACLAPVLAAGSRDPGGARRADQPDSSDEARRLAL
jgi:hypothetical protein